MIGGRKNGDEVIGALLRDFCYDIGIISAVALDSFTAFAMTRVAVGGEVSAQSRKFFWFFLFTKRTP